MRQSTHDHLHKPLMLYNELSDQQQTTLLKVLSSLSPADQKVLEAWVSKRSAEEFDELKRLLEGMTSSSEEVEIKAILPELFELLKQDVNDTAAKKHPVDNNSLDSTFRSYQIPVLYNIPTGTLPLSPPQASPNQSVIPAWPRRFKQLSLAPPSKNKLKEALQRHSREEQKVLLQFFNHADKKHQTAFLKALATQSEKTIENLLPWFIARHKEPKNREKIQEFIQDPKRNALDFRLKFRLGLCIGTPALGLQKEFLQQLENTSE